MKYFYCFSKVLLFLICISTATYASDRISLKENDHIAFIGNALADRMQHDGCLESYIYLAEPDKQLVLRNLGFTGDELVKRPRSQGYMTEHEALTLVGADVIFAFFGYNESYDHNPEKFKRDLNKFLDETAENKYNGKSAPKVVLFSPIAFENLNSNNYPDGEEQNLWLSIYTDAMARVAQEREVLFVDLFAPSKALYEKSEEALTVNGAHLNKEGNREIAKVIVNSLWGDAKEQGLEKVQNAVLDKNWNWYNRYRATDGNDVWGSRSTLEFVDKQTNAVVLQHELKMLDVKTANRDKVIWAAVQGKIIQADDSNVPDPVQVETNYAPSASNGSPDFVPASKGVDTLKLDEGLEANLFASEEQFPELVNPVQMDVDTKGRIWVAAWQTYPKWQPDQEMLDRLLILPDDNHDGLADKAITFAYIHNPTGFTFWNGGVIVASAPDLWFLKDTDGDDVADVKELLLGGLDSADTHHCANGFDFGPDGYIYFQRGVFIVSNVETPWQSAQLNGQSAMYRFNPRTHRYSIHAMNEPNPHGGDFDYWGYHFATDATSGLAYQVRMEGDGKFKMHELLKKTVRPVPSSGILSSMHFPESMNGNYIILNAIGFLGIKKYTLEYTDGIAWGTEANDLLVSSDGNFRPSDYKIGDDGALYVADWSNSLIGHMQHNVRDPLRDHDHGRIYRITATGRPLQEHVEIDGQPIEKLLDALKHPTDGIRLRARIELSERDATEVLAATNKWIMQFDANKKEDAHHLLEALWLHQQFNVVDEALLNLMLHSSNEDARRAAERVKYIWEIEGQLGENVMAMPAHAAHHGNDSHSADDYFAQERSPEPVMMGDTLEVHIYTLKEQMRYDRTRFAVEPGTKVRVVFKNIDAMDHNMLFVQPDSASEVAAAAGLLGADGIKKQWLPESDKIIAASNLLSVGQSQTFEFTAPKNKGIYDYICTYPGHWMLMRGTMHVVEDVDAWMAENPNEEAAGHEWKVSELAGDLGKLTEDRSLDRGKEIFTKASCVACHQVGTEGGVVGPNLLGVSERLTPEAMLIEILEPSNVINPKFKPWHIELENFEEVNGIITEENDDFVSIIENPLISSEATKIPIKDITKMSEATTSSMPLGLLNTYTREDILDLMAYIRTESTPKQ